MDDLKIILEVNKHGELVLPFSRCVLNLPRIEDCLELRNLIVQQGNNLVWWYVKMFENIQFKTTVRELNEIYDRNIVEKVKQQPICKDIVLINDSNNIAVAGDDDDDDIQWISGPGESSNASNA